MNAVVLNGRTDYVETVAVADFIMRFSTGKCFLDKEQGFVSGSRALTWSVVHWQMTDG